MTFAFNMSHFNLGWFTNDKLSSSRSLFLSCWESYSCTQLVVNCFEWLRSQNILINSLSAPMFVLRQDRGAAFIVYQLFSISLGTNCTHFLNLWRLRNSKIHKETFYKCIDYVWTFFVQYVYNKNIALPSSEISQDLT